jgi:hypothetical protein
MQEQSYDERGSLSDLHRRRLGVERPPSQEAHDLVARIHDYSGSKAVVGHDQESRFQQDAT